MKRKYLLIALATILIVMLTTGIGILTSYVSNFVNPLFKPFALPVLGIIALVVSALTLWLYFLQRITDRQVRTLNSQSRHWMLERVQAFWIKGVLEKSLHGAALIALGLYERLDILADPRGLNLQQLDQSARLLPAGTRITQVYNDAAGGLLILGEPGSGKTTLLLELVRDLLDYAKQDATHPMPVVFNLSSWAVKRQPIITWLVEELNDKYQVPHRLAHSWVEADQVLPLLDGLDEVEAAYRTACINAINSYRQEHGLVPIVICSRSTEYLTQTKYLQLHRAVVVQPLTPEQIDDYLQSTGGQLVNLRMALRKDTVLLELAATPLMLSVLTLAYHGISFETLLKGSLETQRRTVFATYVEYMLRRRGTNAPYIPQQTIHWLAWLARQMRQQSQTVFYIERLQPDWLPDSWLRWFYDSVLLLTTGLIGGVGLGLSYGLIIGSVDGMNNGLYVGAGVGMISAIIFLLGIMLFLEPITKIKPAEVVSWSWENVRQNLIETLVGGLIVGLFAGMGTGLISMLNIGPVGKLFFRPVDGIDAWWGIGLISWLAFGLVFVLLTMVHYGLSSEMLEEHKFVKPNQGIQHSGRNCVFIGLPIVIIVGLVVWPLIGPITGLGIGLSCGILIGLLNGGFACIQHAILRLFLWRTGSVPLNYPRFLDYGAECILLHKVGGGYIFLHQVLLEYFASLDAMSPSG